MPMLFNSKPPLAERLRPVRLDDLVGQEHLVGEKGVIRKTIQSGNIPSMIFWGPPGVGKTTIANIIANEAKKPFYILSAISAGVKDIREIIDKAKSSPRSILFIDEIHRFNKSQQDALLGAVEKGIITLIGATTENPSFEVNSALLSRSQVYTLNALEEKDLLKLVNQALVKDEELKKKEDELAKEKDNLKKDYTAVIKEKLEPQFKKVTSFLKNEYLAASRTTSGIGSLPNGAALYQTYVKLWTTTDKTPAEIHELGLKEVARIKAEMEKVKEQVGFKGTINEFFEYVRTKQLRLLFFINQSEYLFEGLRLPTTQ